VLVALYAGGENWFGVDAVATRHNFSLFKLKKNRMQAEFLAVELKAQSGPRSIVIEEICL
jgi:hypothetical protein